jgi:two-component system response regulator RegA
MEVLDARRSVLVVDDDATFRRRLVEALERRGLDARGAATMDEATSAALVESPELAVVDLRIGTDWGLDVVKELLRIDGSTRVLVLTGYGSIATAIEAMRLGAVHYLTKPADVDQILAAFEATEGSAPQGGRSAQQPEVPTLARVEWEHIQRVLVDCGGNVSQAARLLGVHRRSLQRKLSKYPSSR